MATAPTPKPSGAVSLTDMYMPLDNEHTIHLSADEYADLVERRRAYFATAERVKRWSLTAPRQRVTDALQPQLDYVDAVERLAEAEKREAVFNSMVEGMDAQLRRMGAEPDRRATPRACSSARPRERRPICRRAAARAPGGDDDPPAAGDSDLNVLLQAAFAAGLSARECFEASAILERRGEWLMGRAS